MKNEVMRAISFLKSCGMDPEQVDSDTVVQSFLKEMERGLKGGPSSLMMLPTYLTAEGNIPRGETVIALDAGGTNFRVAAVSIDSKGNPVINSFKKFPMPGTVKEKTVSRNEFFNTIAGYMDHIADASSKVGFCFSYPTEMLPSGDGRLITFTKEVKAPEVEGALIGRNLLDALKKNGISDEKKIVILNDSVATLLAGETGHSGQYFETYIGFILGTGMNTCYVEKTANITKIDQNPKLPAHQIINIESGKFASFTGGIVDQQFAASTDKPEESLFEKKISGAYQGSLALAVLKKAAEDKLFSPGTAASIQEMHSLETITMDGFLHSPYDTNNLLVKICLEEDKTTMYTILYRIVERAAKLAAASLSATVLKTGKGSNPLQPVCIVADGTTYFKTKGLQLGIQYYVKDYLEKKHGIYTEFISGEDAPLVGAAVAALLYRN